MRKVLRQLQLPDVKWKAFNNVRELQTVNDNEQHKGKDTLDMRDEMKNGHVLQKLAL